MSTRDVDDQLLARLRGGGDRGQELVRRQVERELAEKHLDEEIRIGNLERRKSTPGAGASLGGGTSTENQALWFESYYKRATSEVNTVIVPNGGAMEFGGVRAPVTEGMFMIALLGARATLTDNTHTIIPPDGWTTIELAPGSFHSSQNSTAGLFCKIATAADAAAAGWTFTLSDGETATWSSWLHAFNPRKLGLPIRSEYAILTATDEKTITPPISSPRGNVLDLRAVLIGSAVFYGTDISWSVPPAIPTGYDGFHLSDGLNALAFAWRVRPAAGNYGAQEFVHTGGPISQQDVGFSVILAAYGAALPGQTEVVDDDGTGTHYGTPPITVSESAAPPITRPRIDLRETNQGDVVVVDDPALDAVRVTIGVKPATVNGRWLRTVGGAVVWQALTAADVPFTPAGTIAATTVQAAIEEVASEAGSGGGGGGSGSGGGGLAKLYDYTVTGADKASIDTAVDGTTVADFAGCDEVEIVIYARTDEAAVASVLALTVNNDATSIYDNERVSGVGATASAGGSAGDPAWLNNIAGASAAANVFGYMRVRIPNPNGTTGYKVAEMLSGFADTNGANSQISARVLSYRSTSAVTRLKVTPATAGKLLKVGTRVTVYGRKATGGIGGGGETELDYVERTTAQAVTATTEATAHTLITSGTVTYDGQTKIVLEYFAPDANCGVDAVYVFSLWDGATELGWLGLQKGTGAEGAPVLIRRIFTPTAGPHAYTVKVRKTVATSSFVNAGSGGAGAYLPSYLRITTGARLDGWLDDTAETWTYASGSGGGTATFTVPGDLTAKYTTGTRIKLTQTTVKYFVVVGSAHAAGTTTVTITAGTTYTLANAAISANGHSYEANPRGYPGWFDFAPALGGFSGTPTISLARFSVVGRQMVVTYNWSGTSNATTFTAVLPIAAAAADLAQARVTDNGSTSATTPGLAISTAGSTTLSFGSNLANAAWTAANTKGAIGQIIVEI